MPCGCGSYTPVPNTCNKNLTVCKGEQVLFNPGCNTPIIVTTPTQGTVSFQTLTNLFLYEHNGLNSLNDTFTYQCGSQICTANVTVLEGIQANQTVITLTAEGTCETGEPTFTWNIPSCAALMPGYTIHNSTIQLAVNNYNPLLTPEEQICEITVDVCCGACINCCKCKKFYWNPPICTGDCENTVCNCTAPCTFYNPVTGNCEPLCNTEQVEHCINVARTFGLIDDNGLYKAMLTIQDGVTTPLDRIYIGQPLALNASTGFVNMTQMIDITNNTTGIMFGNVRVSDAISSTGDHTIRFEETSAHSNGNYYLDQVNSFIIGLEKGTACGMLRQYRQIKFNPLFPTGTTANQLNGYITFETTTLTGRPITPNRACCTETINNHCCIDGTTNWCAECCNQNECIPTIPCTTPPICTNGKCVCYVNGIEVPPNENGCCPECISNIGCQECSNGVLLPAPTCFDNEILLPDCTCYCDCIQGYCLDMFELDPTKRCKPCPTGCTPNLNQWLYCGIPYNLPSCPPCQTCNNGSCEPGGCAGDYIANPNFNFAELESKTNPCCVPDPCLNPPTLNIQHNCSTNTYTISVVGDTCSPTISNFTVSNSNGDPLILTQSGNTFSVVTTSSFITVVYINCNNCIVSATKNTTCVSCNVTGSININCEQNTATLVLNSLNVTYQYCYDNSGFAGCVWSTPIIPTSLTETLPAFIATITSGVRVKIISNDNSNCFIEIYKEINCCQPPQPDVRIDCVTQNNISTLQGISIGSFTSSCSTVSVSSTIEFNNGASPQISSGTVSSSGGVLTTNLFPISTIANVTVLICCGTCCSTFNPELTCPTISYYKCEQGEVEAITAMIVFDSSASQSSAATTQRAFTKQIIDDLYAISGTKVGYIDFDKGVNLYKSVNGNHTAATLKTLVDQSVINHPSPKTNFDCALNLANYDLGLYNGANKKYIIWITDGIATQLNQTCNLCTGMDVNFVPLPNYPACSTFITSSFGNGSNIAIANDVTVVGVVYNGNVNSIAHVESIGSNNITYVATTSTLQQLKEVFINGLFVNPGSACEVVNDQNYPTTCRCEAVLGYNCSNNCVETVPGGIYTSYTECINNCSQSMGFNCGACNTEVLGGQYPNSTECNLNCGSTFGYNCANCDQFVQFGQYITSEECKSACPQMGYNCPECTEQVLNGQYQTPEVCQSACVDCNTTFTGNTVNGVTLPVSKYQLVCQGNQAVCIQNDSATSNFVTNSNCTGLTLTCGNTNSGGLDCIYYDETANSIKAMLYSTIPFLKQAIEDSVLTGQQKLVNFTYSFRPDYVNNNLLGATIDEAKIEMHNALNEIGSLFSCLFPLITINFMNKNGGLNLETSGDTSTYGNLRIGTDSTLDGAYARALNTPLLNQSTVISGNTYSSNGVFRTVLNATQTPFRLNSNTVYKHSARSIMDNFIHEVGHTLGLHHAQAPANQATTSYPCDASCPDEYPGCNTSGGGCCTPPTEVICGCGSSNCEQWTNWYGSPYYVKGIWTIYKPNSLDTFTPLNNYTNDIICL
jgi:hypothetical protein